MKRKFTDKEEIERIINRSSVCRLGLSDGGRPYVVPLNFAYTNSTLYFHSAPAGKKLDIIRQNPEVCVEFDIPGGFRDNPDPCKAGFSYESVIGFGLAVFVEDLEEKNRALLLITEKYSRRSYSFSGEEMVSVVVLKVDFRELTGKASD